MAGLSLERPVVVRVPKTRDTGNLPRTLLQCPGQRRGSVSMEHRTAGPSGNTTRAQQDTVADRRHGLLCFEKLRDQFLKRFAFEVTAHAARAMPARQKQTVER